MYSFGAVILTALPVKFGFQQQIMLLQQDLHREKTVNLKIKYREEKNFTRA